MKALCFLLSLLPNLHINMKPPKYHGFHEEADNQFYTELERSHPGVWKTSSKLLLAMLECFTAPDSAVKGSLGIPTLVFKTLHDRYFSPGYFDEYYDSLTCKKKLAEIDDVHNSWVLKSSFFCEEAYAWFMENR